MWTTLTLAGHPVELLLPESSAVGVVIDLHDRDGQTLREDSSTAHLFRQDRLVCCCPHGGESWWSDRLCESFDALLTAERWLLDHVVPFLHSNCRVPIALTGRGMGGQGALRLGFKHPSDFRIVVARDAAIDHYEIYDDEPVLQDMYSSREVCRQDSATLHVHPARQPAHLWFACHPSSLWFRGNDRLHEKLAALGVAHTFVDESHGQAALMPFIRSVIASESRRLL